MDSARRGFLTGRTPAAHAEGERVAIAQACLARRGVECRICGEACDSGAIRFRPQLGSVAQPVLDPDACTACGDCVPVCPVAAVTLAPRPS
jgi:ferredoxin-type protein NapF